MTASETLTALMDAVRGVSCTGDKLSIPEATQELSTIAGTDNKLLTMPLLIDVAQPGVTSAGNNFLQTISVRGHFFEILPKENVYIPVTKGETIKQAITIKANKTLPLFYISFFGTKSGHHHVKINLLQIGSAKYRASAEYTFEQNESLRVFDLYNDKLGEANMALTFSQPFVGVVSEVCGGK